MLVPGIYIYFLDYLSIIIYNKISYRQKGFSGSSTGY